MVNHKHHIIENVNGQRKRLDKTITLTLQQHADIHKHYYDLWGFREDYMAWKCLSGQLGKEDILIEKSRIGGIKNQGIEKSSNHKQLISKSITEWHSMMKRTNPKRTEEHKKKISESMKGNKNSQNHKSKEYKQKQSLAMKKAWERRKKNI